MTIDVRKIKDLLYPAILSVFLLTALGITLFSGLFIARQINVAMSSPEPEPPSSDLILDLQATHRVATHLQVSTSATPEPLITPPVIPAITPSTASSTPALPDTAATPTPPTTLEASVPTSTH